MPIIFSEWIKYLSLILIVTVVILVIVWLYLGILVMVDSCQVFLLTDNLFSARVYYQMMVVSVVVYF